MRPFAHRIAIGMFLVLSAPAQAACPDQAAIDAYVADFAAARSSKGFGNDLTLSDAECARGRLVQALPKILGEIVGYKAGFTTAAQQKRFELPGPAYGVMFAKSMAESGARLPAKFGAFPRYEADLVMVVKDAGLADAKTPLEALQHISEVAPFIELPDRMIEGDPLGNALISTNVAFRGGVLGNRIKVEPTQAFLDSLANMTVVMSEDRVGKELGRAKGDLIMGNPVNAAMWLAQALKKDGLALKPGDLLSLGGYFPSTQISSGTTISVKYLGLQGDPAVTTHFD